MAKVMMTTQEGDRPDLAGIGKLQQLAVGGYVFPQIFPIVTSFEKASTLTLAAANLVTAVGTKNRANGVTLNRATAAQIDINWTATRYEGRAQIYFSQGKSYRDVGQMDQVGAMQADARCWNALEKDSFDKIFTTARKTASTALPNHSVVETIQKGALACRAYGNPYLVTTINGWLSFCAIPEIRWRLEKLTGATGDVAYLTLNNEAVRAAISTFLQIGGVKVYDHTIVGTAMDNQIAIVPLRPELFGKGPDEVMAGLQLKAAYGFTMVYLPDAATADVPFEVRAWVDNEAKANVYDAEGFMSLNEIVASGESPAVSLFTIGTDYTEIGA